MMSLPADSSWLAFPAALLANGAEASAGLWQRLAPCLACPLCWSLVLGALGLWLVLPGGRRRWQCGGMLCAAASLVLLAVWLPTPGPVATRLVFWPLAALVAGAAVATISSRSPVYCALWFALVLLGVASLFLLQGAQFLSLATVVVYAGAIVVMFLFVLMLAQPSGQAFYDRLSWGALPLASASLVAAAIAGGMAFATAQFDGMRRHVVAVLPECRHPETGEPYLQAEKVLAAQLTTTPQGGTVLHLAVRAEPNEPVLLLERDRGLVSQLAQKGFDQRTEEFFLVLTAVSSTGEPLMASNHVATLGGRLFGTHLVSVEVAGTLLLAALVGAIAIAVQGRNLSPRGEAHHA